MNKEKALKKNKLFAFVPNKTLKSISLLFREHHLARGESIIEQGEPSQLFFLVHKGKVKTVYEHHHEHELSAGDYFGELAVLDEKARVLSAFAVQANTELLSITRTDFMHCRNAFPAIATVVTNIVTDRLCTIGLGGYERTIGNYSISRGLIWNNREVWFHGEHSYLARPLRIQMIPHLAIRDEKYRERLHNKLKVLAGIDHPSIIRPLDVVDAYGTHFIIYDRENGVPLSEILARVRSVPHPVITALILKIAGILGFLHGQDLIHTDLRPENIYLSPRGEVRLGNMGILHPGYLVPEYMSPEQMQKKHVGKGTDIYALGTLAYVLAAGKFPFDAKEEDLLLRQKMECKFTKLHEINPALPDAIVQFVSRSLEPKSDKRFDNLTNLTELFSVWSEEAGKRGGRHEDRRAEVQVASEEQIAQWLAKKYFQNLADEDDRENASMELPRVGRGSHDHLAPLFDNPEDIVNFRLLTFEDFIGAHYSVKPELAVTFSKDEIVARLHAIEQERQELAVAHVLFKALQKCSSRKKVFDMLRWLLEAVEKDKNYALLARKEKKIKNQAERTASGSNYLPDSDSDHVAIEKAEGKTAPFVFRDKNNFILLCPLSSKTRFFGCICVASRVKKELEARLFFYKLVGEIVPVFEFET